MDHKVIGLIYGALHESFKLKQDSVEQQVGFRCICVSVYRTIHVILNSFNMPQDFLASTNPIIVNTNKNKTTNRRIHGILSFIMRLSIFLSPL